MYPDEADSDRRGTENSIPLRCVQMVQEISRSIDLPKIASIHIADAEQASTPGADGNCKFGAIVLDDGTVGIAYTDLDDAFATLQDKSLTAPLIGACPSEVATLFLAEEAWRRSLGTAAINAVSQHVLERSGHQPPDGGPTVQALNVTAEDYVGMVGFFPSVVRAVADIGAQLTVIERDERWFEQAPQIDVVADTRRLGSCNKVLITATTLINHSLDHVLECCSPDAYIAVIGPTAGLLPDPLFERGVDLLGGCSVVDTTEFLHRWGTFNKWRDATRRYVWTLRDYPGYRQLLAAISP